jgi:hypothetical protein
VYHDLDASSVHRLALPTLIALRDAVKVPSRHNATLHYFTEVRIRASYTTTPFLYFQSSRGMQTCYLESAYINGNVHILRPARGVHP